MIAQHCAVAVQSVHAYIVGEHGDSEIPLWSGANIGSVPVRNWEIPGRGPLNAADEQAILYGVRNSADIIIPGKGATNYAIGLAGSTILEALLWNERRAQPVSSLLTDYRGISDVSHLRALARRTAGRGASAARPHDRRGRGRPAHQRRLHPQRHPHPRILGRTLCGRAF